MSVLTDSLKKGDHAILYVSPYAKFGAESNYIGDFLECYVVGLMKDMSGDQDDDRIFVRCSRNLAVGCCPRTGIYPDEELISVDSPFLMTWQEYKGCKFDPDYLNNWLQTIDDTIHFDEGLCNIQNLHDVVLNMSQAFRNEHREAICFPR